jgi:5'-3' exoribonuclease 1
MQQFFRYISDLLPNLPDLRIHENGLERLFDVYTKVLPSLGKS